MPTLLSPSLHNKAAIVIDATISGYAGTGAIFGFMTSIIALASGLGPLFAGAAYDHFGTYTPVLVTRAIISLVSGALMFSLGNYPDWHAPAEPVGKVSRLRP